MSLFPLGFPVNGWQFFLRFTVGEPCGAPTPYYLAGSVLVPVSQISLRYYYPMVLPSRCGGSEKGSVVLGEVPGGSSSQSQSQ